MRSIIIIASLLIAIISNAQQKTLPLLKISSDKHHFQTSAGKPFFWLGDTGWLLFVKCNKEETIQYLDTRQQQGFNVIQVMVLHSLGVTNTNGDSALIKRNVAQPNIKPGADNDYWDHVDFVVKEAAKRGIYMALVPVWGSNVKEGKVNRMQAESYAKFLALRYRDQSNIIWLNGGDLRGSDSLEVWKTIGKTLRKYDPRHLITFHPRGRYSSSDWFHNESWLDFNMFQSGHRTYAQDTTASEKNHFGEDNWRYAKVDYAMKPAKPTMDGEPSYENIPHGLHDSLQPRWTAADLRRYAYWSVLAGGAGFTYGENSVMQFHTSGDADANYGVERGWKQTVNATGASQMKYLRQLMEIYTNGDWQPAQEIIADNHGVKYDYNIAAKGKKYALIYTYTGKPLKIDCSKLGFTIRRVTWFNPSTGNVQLVIAPEPGSGIVEMSPPGNPADGNDHVLILGG
ncbi:MAG TPA: glycoside hydrolase family 140 protein [Chitinophagaceae bacterium]|jgi:hypothetical protein|nr:glycoside hydrolase family 140 protein [Chitinophagaceae bacterium]